MPDFKKDFTLSEYWERISRAHYNVSFWPEKRADSYVKDFSEELDQDLIELGENAGNYKKKYVERFLSWIDAKGRCISSMITGPARFPTRKAEKANNSEHNRYEEFRHWREKYFKAVNRQRTLSPEEDLEILCKNLDKAIILNGNLKEWNKSIRSFKAGKIDEKQLSVELSEKGITDYYLKFMCQSIDYSYWKGFGTNSVQIKKLRERAEALKSRIETKATWEDIEFEGGRIAVEDDRVKIFHDEKPEKEIIQELKRNGFRWSRYWNCWARKHTGMAIQAAKRIVINQ